MLKSFTLCFTVRSLSILLLIIIASYDTMAQIVHNYGTWGITKPLVQNVAYKWTIENFLSLTHKHNEVLMSPKFSLPNYEDYEWHMRLYPKGWKTQTLSMYIRYNGTKTKDYLMVTHNFTMYDAKGKIFNTFSHTDPEVYRDHGVGAYSMIELDKFYASSNVILKNKALTVGVDFIAISGQSNVYDDCKRKLDINSMCYTDHLKQFLYADWGADVWIIVENQTIPAHQIILGSRISDFQRFLQLRDEKLVWIIDDVNSEVVRELLQFLYTGRLNVNGMISGLSVMAKNYRIESLTILMEQKMCSEMNATNVIEIALIADMLGWQMMKTKAINYIISDPDIIKSSEFMQLSKQRTSLMSEIIKAISENMV